MVYVHSAAGKAKRQIRERGLAKVLEGARRCGSMIRRPIKFLPPLGAPKLSPRERALAQWRAVDLTPLEEIRRPAKHAGEVISRVMKDIRFDVRRKEAEIVQVWNGVLSPTITAHAQPVGLVKGTLFVNVDSSVWLSEIVRWHQKEILERLQHSFGRKMIERISFRLG